MMKHLDSVISAGVVIGMALTARVVDRHLSYRFRSRAWTKVYGGSKEHGRAMAAALSAPTRPALIVVERDLCERYGTEPFLYARAS